MRITERGDSLVLDDTPGCLWLFGLLFVGSGSLALSTPFVAANRHAVGWRVNALAAVIGLVHLPAGLWWIRGHPATHTQFDRAAGTGRHRVRVPGARAAVVTEFRLADVRGLELWRGADSDGDPVFQLRLWLAGSQVLALHSHPVASGEWADARAEELRRFLAPPEPVVGGDAVGVGAGGEREA